MDAVLSTDQVPPRERVAYWREVICRTFVRLDVDTATGPFAGQVTSVPVGAVRFSRIDANPMTVHRRLPHIDEARQDEVLLAVHLAGEAFGAQDGRQVHLRPGDLALFDAGRPYTVDFTGPSAFHHLVVQMPTALLRPRLGGLESVTAVPIRHTEPLGGLVWSFLTNLARRAPALDPALHETLAAQAMDLVATTLGSRTGRTAADSVRTTHLRRAYAYVEAHLGDPGLCPASIAAGLHISERYLHRLFETEPRSVIRTVWSRRLDRCRRDLSDPALNARTVMDIARRWGFRDPAHFSRTFRARYGHSPSERRA
ncbi:helix-turn-helix domain-containing protein [Plantactinospora sp. GCM10030261]|uniref:AraC-like ligand-binding domain-containing protein n=1 Tax=Plantactinospora sp. GCM10030261 TaxID=3273420 RepID=UPI00361AB926